jgi:BMFP domain-containing protein YqiC
MQDWKLLLDDLAKMAQSAFGLAADFKADGREKFKIGMEKFLRDMDLVTRQEFKAVQAMAEKARSEQLALSKRLAALEGKQAKPAKAKTKVKSKPAKRR